MLELLFEQASQSEIDVDRDRHEASCARLLRQAPGTASDDCPAPVSTTTQRGSPSRP